MELGFAHCSLEAEEQTVIKMPGIVDAVFINDQGVAEGAELDQTMPIARRARQARDFDADDRAGAAEADLADQALEADAVVRGFAGASEIVVDDHNLLFRPAELISPLDQRILSFGAFLVAQDLLQGGLADVDVSVAFQMGRRDFGISDRRQHRAPPVSC